jgi:hypothetical protein
VSRTLLSALLLLVTAAGPARSQQQVADTTFVPQVAKPAFTKRHPVVMIDGAHGEWFTMVGLYRGFTALLTQDGLRVIPGVQPFSPQLLKACQVLVVADAIATADLNGPEARASAFRGSECDAVRDWVKEGGSLLFIADPAPFGSAMDSLAVRFGVDLGKGTTADPRQADPEIANIGCILFRRDRGLVGSHPITRGRDPGERINRVASFTGQSLKGPRGSTGLLVLSPSAIDLPFSPDARHEATPEALRKADTLSRVNTPGAVTAVERFQGVAFGFGRGRVVVLGDAAMFGSQFVLGDDAARMGKDVLRIGLNRPDLDNQQFALNVVRWLARVLN